MNMAYFAARARNALRKPISHLAKRALVETQHKLARFSQPRFGRKFGARDLLARTNARTIDELWNQLGTTLEELWGAPRIAPGEYESLAPGDATRIVAAAERAARHEIDLMGSGPISLGPSIDWLRDFKTNDRWPLAYFRTIDYINRDRPSDAKTVWELSRLQWALPCGQAFMLTGNEEHAAAAREVIEQWIAGNPYAYSVNWGVTMEAALRIINWAWLLHACGRSRAWSDTAFRERLLCAMYLHGIFTEEFFERSDVNGNHFTADASGLVMVGWLFREGDDAKRWFANGLADLEHDVVLQVHSDGVDFEASTAYHRFVAELFLLGSMVAQADGRKVSDAYRERLAGMARFTAAYLRPDGLAPLWGDNDDARALPMGPQVFRNHEYLVGLIGLHLNDSDLINAARGSRSEAAWWLGIEEARRLPTVGAVGKSQAFREGGVYVIRDARNHVFIDCGPLGLAGRGGHGHNDLLSFEAVLDGVSLVTEGGCYVYTADTESRDRDRSTSSHNTPLVDHAEINRFIGTEFRWNLHNDASHEVTEFSVGSDVERFVGRHTGYQRLPGPVVVERTIELMHSVNTLHVVDRFFGEGDHGIEVPLHLSPDVKAELIAPGCVSLLVAGKAFELSWTDLKWVLKFGIGREAASYGRQQPIQRLSWSRTGSLLTLDWTVRPVDERRKAWAGPA